jgi:eukaryotic-like serine/threonine-protein kinase
MASLEGQSLGRYHLLEKIGEGGMATVYKARDTRLERNVAVKIIRVENFSPNILGSVMERFEREARSLAQLSHPYIVKVIDYGEYQQAPYLVLEYLPGGTLKQRIGQPIPYTQAARILLPIARALAYAHGEGIVHRDVKPSNILLNQSGEPLLADFGIAKILEAVGGQTLTGSGVAVGTPDYMAPEQWLGEVVPQTDIYALGVVLFEMLTGHKPFEADTPAGLLLKQTSGPPPRANHYVPDLPEQVEQTLGKALHKDLGERYANMNEFARALEKLAMFEPGEEISTAKTAPLRRDDTVDGQRDKSQDNLSSLQERVDQAINLEAWDQANALVDRMSELFAGAG